jgi:hypothetical protein
MNKLEDFVNSPDWLSQWGEYETYLASRFLSAASTSEVLILFGMLEAARNFKENIEVLCHEQDSRNNEDVGKPAGRKFYGNKQPERG